MDWKVFSEVLRSLDSQCTDAQLDLLRRRGEGEATLSAPGMRLESALKWIFTAPSDLR